MKFHQIVLVFQHSNYQSNIISKVRVKVIKKFSLLETSFSISYTFARTVVHSQEDTRTNPMTNLTSNLKHIRSGSYINRVINLSTKRCHIKYGVELNTCILDIKRLSKKREITDSGGHLGLGKLTRPPLKHW